MLEVEDGGAAPKTGRIALRGLRKRFGDVVAVDDLTLEISPGEFISLLGPSGSGKTTTLMMIAGFETPDRGQIVLDDKDITRLPSHRRQLGVVFQNYALFPHMTVAENVAYPLRMRHMAKAEVETRVRRILAQVHMGELASRYPHQMSGGQQQRVAIARALVFEPPVLLLDEPLGALDRKLREHLKNEMRALHRVVGKTMVYVTHDQDEALAMSDRVVVMHEGRIRQVATPQEIYRRPADMFVATFVGAINRIPVKLRSGVALGPADEQLPAPQSSEADGDFALCVRPEHLRLERSPATTSGGIPGRIVDVTFTGEATIFAFKSDIGLELTAKKLNASAEGIPRLGDACVATWTANDATIFREGTAGSSAALAGEPVLAPIDADIGDVARPGLRGD